MSSLNIYQTLVKRLHAKEAPKSSIEERSQNEAIVISSNYTRKLKNDHITVAWSHCEAGCFKTIQ